MPRRGKKVAIACGAILVAIVVAALVNSREIAVRYHLYRLREDPEYVLQLDPDDPIATESVSRFLADNASRTAFVGLYLQFALLDRRNKPNRPPVSHTAVRIDRERMWRSWECNRGTSTVYLHGAPMAPELTAMTGFLPAEFAWPHLEIEGVWVRADAVGERIEIRPVQLESGVLDSEDFRIIDAIDERMRDLKARGLPFVSPRR